MGHGYPDCLYDLYHGIGTRLFRRVLRDGGGLSLQDCLSREERDLKRILLVYLSVSATGWLVTFCYQFYPSLFVRLNVVCLLCFVLPSIFFYRIVRFHEAGRAGGIPPLIIPYPSWRWRCWSGRASCLSTCGWRS
ncbi:MAG: hypothetical protein ACLSB7_07790 [Parabacteroides distasonis]